MCTRYVFHGLHNTVHLHVFLSHLIRFVRECDYIQYVAVLLVASRYLFCFPWPHWMAFDYRWRWCWTQEFEENEGAKSRMEFGAYTLKLPRRYTLVFRYLATILPECVKKLFPYLTQMSPECFKNWKSTNSKPFSGWRDCVSSVILEIIWTSSERGASSPVYGDWRQVRLLRATFRQVLS